MTQLNHHQAQYVQALWSEMRAATHQYRTFDAKWNKLNDELEAKFDADGIEMVQRAKDKTANLTLQGYMDGAKWFRDKAASLAAVIQAEQAAMEMIKGSESWLPPSPRPQS